MRITIDVHPHELDWGKSWAKRERESAEVHGAMEFWELVDFDVDDVSFDGRDCTIHDDDVDAAILYLLGED